MNFAERQQLVALSTQQSATPAELLALHVYKHAPALVREQIAMAYRATVAPATSTDADWAGPLTAPPLLAAYVQALRPASALAQLLDAAPPPVDASGISGATVPVGVTAIGASWLGEGGPIAIVQGSVGLRSIDVRKVGGAIAASEEAILRAGFAEAFGPELLAAIAQALDSKAFSGDAATSISPAGLFAPTNATSIAPAAGANFAAAAADLSALMAQQTSSGARVDAAAARWCMSPTMFLRLSELAAGLGLAVSNIIGNVPVLFVAAQDAHTLGLLDASHVYTALSAPPVARSGDASVMMSDAPTSDIGGSASPVVSLFQRGLVGFRAVSSAGWITADARGQSVIFSTTW